MKETLEREIKLAPDDGFVLPELGGRGCRRASSSRPITTRPTCGSRGNGVTFRHRVEDGGGLWQLKLPRDAARLELEVGGPPARPPAELSALLPAYLRGASSCPSPGFARGGRSCTPRAPRSSTTAWPSSRDSGSPAASGRSRSSCSTVTSERCAGSRRSCARRAPAPPASCSRSSTARSTSQARSRRGRARRARRRARRSGSRSRPSYRALLAHDPGTRRGDDPEELHQLRVATRRLRAFLRAARQLVDRGVGGVAARARSAGSAGTSARPATST